MNNNLKKRTLTSITLLSLLFLIFNYNIFMIYFIILFGVLSLIEFFQITKKIFLNKFYYYLINSFFIIYIFIFCIMFFILSNVSGLKIILFILLIGCVASDIGGFIFGKILKGPKLTNISPKKTISGSVGSILLTILFFCLFFLYLDQSLGYRILITALATSIFCQLGDLIFSFLKRKAGLKDTGKILPGHGGVLDRLDGILLGMPIGFLTLTLLH
tara:strand:- start:178 stop:825 length:648 start_codon:yes stop_codon:yes gene_type:complete